MNAIDQLRSLHTLPRTGWVRRGIKDPETVAEHTAECVAIALALADRLGVNRDTLVKMLEVHDWAESDPEVGDITPHCGISPDEKFRRERVAMEALCAQLPQGDRLLNLWLEFEEAATPEAQIAKQIDKLQMGFKAVMYHREQGFDPAEFMYDVDRHVTDPVLRGIFDRLKQLVAATE